MPNKNNIEKKDRKIKLKSGVNKFKSKTANKPKIETDKSSHKLNSKPKNAAPKTKLKSEKKEIKKSDMKNKNQVKKPKSEKKFEKKIRIKGIKPIVKTMPKVTTKTKVKKVMSQPKKSKIYAILLNYRLGHSEQHNREFLIRIPNINDEYKASKFIGHRAIWRSKSGTKIVGNILRIHGKNGVLRARFRKGLPGQARGKNVEII